MFKHINIKNILMFGMFFLLSLVFSQNISAATFTVDSTGDEADTNSGDGLCLTALGTCTLRAAITAAANLAGADNIYFNIPTSDPGYRDYDAPDTPSSGDSVGGDDYWTIRPVTLLGYVFGTIDGETQETNSGFDRNTFGPDIEVDASGIPNPGPQDQAIVGLLGTNGTINKLVLNSYGYGAGIFSNADGVTITKNYIGTDVKGLVKKANVTGIGLNQANNVVIGNNESDGNIITATSYGIFNACNNPNPHKISGNRIGIGADGVTPLPMVHGIFMHTNCNSIIGGDTAAERNYIAATTSYGVRFEGNLNASSAVHEVYNNYFGTDVNGNILESLEIKDAAIMDVYGGNLVGYKTITIGAPDKGNLIANSRYGIRLNVPKSIVTISNNTIVKTIWGILGYRYSNPDPDVDSNWYKDINITNNYIGDYADPDPYFGLTFAPGDWTCTDCYDQKYINRTGISIGGFNGIIKGNKIIGNLYNGINIDNYSSLSVDSIIGGQGILSGSLCSGLEKNCIEDNGTHPLDNSFGGGILLTMAAPVNFDTIYEDNDFGNGNGINLDENVTLYTTGEFELLSGTARRTDLANFDLTIPAPAGSELYDGWGGVYNDGHPGPTLEYTNYNVYCYDPLTCPESGSSSGTDEMTATLISKAGYQDYEPDWFQYYITDAYNFVPLVKIDNEGNRTENTLIKFEENHFASSLFSFDADSTTHPQDYPGLGEPWTDDITATQATSLSKHYYSTESGIKQVMEIQYVDANPIRQNDGSFIIYVDSTTDEDNVSTCGFDDGYGDYSGGGCGGVDGLPDGKTSLREAMFVANQGITPLRIEFDIPTTDAGYRDYDDLNTVSSGDSANDDDLFLISLTSDLPNITDYRDVTIDGSTQETNSGNNRNTFGPDILISGAGTATNVFKTFTSEDTKTLLDLTIKGLVLINSTGNLIETNVNYGTAAGTESLSIIDNYLCTDAKGLELSATCATGVVNSTFVGGSINITNNVIGWSNASTSYQTLRVGAPTTTTQILINNNKIGTNPSGTELTKAVDGYALFVESNSTNTNVLAEDNILNTTEGTCIFARGRLTLESNYCGTDITGDTILTVSEIYSEGAVTITNNVVGRIIGLEGVGGVPVSISNNIIGTNRAKTQKFDLTRFIGAGQTTPLAADLAAVEVWNAIGIFTENYIASTHNGIYIKGLVSPNTLNINNNTFNNIVGNAVRMKDQLGLNISNNIFTNIDSEQVIELLVNNSSGLNSNDALDADNYADDLAANDGMNSPEIEKVTYLGGSKYKIEGTLSNNVAAEAPFDLEICLSQVGAVNCSQTIFYEQNYIEQSETGENVWSVEATIPSTDGSDSLRFTAIATNNESSSSEFSNVFTTDDANYTLDQYAITLKAPADNQTLTINKPLLEWESSLDPDLKQYNIYINNAFYATVDKTENKLQIPTEIINGNYSWYVVGIRNNNTEGGRSSTRTFIVKVEASVSGQTPQTPASYPTLVPISEVPSYPVSTTTIFDNKILENNVVDDQTSVDKGLLEQIKETTDSISPVLPLILGIGLGIGTITTNGGSLMQLGLLFGFKNKKKRAEQEFDDFNSENNNSNKFIKVLAGMGFVYSLIVLISNPIAINFIIAALYILVFGINIWISFKNNRDI